MSPRRRVSAALALSLLLGACRSAPPPNVVIVLADTLRADFLGCYGNAARLTPFVDELASRGVRYTHAYAGSTWTNPSIASLFTSRWQSQHGVLNLFSVLSDRERTLGEALHDRGFASAGFLASRSIPKAAGFGQGFDVWEETLEEWQLKGTGTVVNKRTLEWLDARPPGDRRPVLLYLHYMEPHFPYNPRPDRLEAVLEPRHYTPAERDAWDERVNKWLEHGLEGTQQPEDMAVGCDHYLAEVGSFDQILRELFDGLRARGVLDRAVIVVTGDHGEEFLEHGVLGHGLDLFNETLRVPLIILAPGISPAVVDDPVSLLDVAPTITGLVGALQEPRFEGQSLLPAAPGHPAYAELLLNTLTKEPAQNRTLVVGTHKLILTPDGREEFYDLSQDPGEYDPNGLDETARTALREAIARAQAKAQPDPGAGEKRVIDDATRERLRALGYAQ